ncbi:MAG: APC family permease [Acidimicrobiia bacterium]
MANGGDVTLERGAVGFPTALATTVGLIIASSVLLSATVGYGAGGYVFAIAVVIAYVLMIAQSASFAEGSAILPTAGSVYDYIASGMGRFFAITGTLAAYLLVDVFAGSAEAAAAGIFARANFGDLENFSLTGNWWIGVGLVVILALVNALGIRVYGSVEIGLTIAMWGTLVLFSLVGIFSAKQTSITGFFGDPVFPVNLENILSMVALALFLYVGMEYVVPLAAEVREPARTIPRAMYIGVTAVGFAMFIYGAAIARQVENEVLDPDTGEAILDTPIAIPLFAEEIFGTFGRYWLGIAVLFAAAATLNTVLASIPRILYGMAKDGTVPSVFGYLHPRFREPWVGIALVGLLPILGTLYIDLVRDGDVASIIQLILAAVGAWIFSYVLINISIVALRARRPDIDRPYKTPLYPLPQILATIGLVIAFWYIAPPGLTRSDIYIPFGIMLGASAIYALIWTYFVQKQNPWKPEEPETFLAEEGMAEAPEGM